jgi:hypothetical protein
VALKGSDWVAILGSVAGAGLLGIPEAIGALIDAILAIWKIPPGYGSQIATALGAVCILTGLLVRLLTNKTGAPATAIVANPTVVADGTTVVHDDTPSVGTNLISKGT